MPKNRGIGRPLVRGMLPAPLEEVGTTSLLRVRDRLWAGLLIGLCSLGLAACGGDRQDADEPEAEYPVEIVNAELPARQRLAQSSQLTLTVRNSGDETIPDLAITIGTARADEAAEEEPEADGETEGEDEDGGGAPSPAAPGSFSVRSRQSGLAIPSRPVWILEEGYPRLAGEDAPAGAEAAQTNTFAFGELEAGDAIDMVWLLTPVQPGAYTVSYRVAAGLHGNAVAVTDDGSVPEGEFAVRISSVPPQTRVNDAGEVVPIKKSDIIGQAGSGKQRQELDGE
jgi:hypothetical protein